MTVLLLLACGESSFVPAVVSTDFQAELGEDQFWDGISLIRSPGFQNPELIEQVTAEVRAINSTQDGPPCNWWRRVDGEEDASNCGWQTISVFAGDSQLDTYLADSITLVAILPETPGSWPMTLRVRGWQGDLGTVQSYGFSGIMDGPPISWDLLEWPRAGIGMVLGLSSSLDLDGTVNLRHLDLQTGLYSDYSLGDRVTKSWTLRAPARTWDRDVIWFPSRPSPVDSVVAFWRLAPLTPVMSPDGFQFGACSLQENWQNSHALFVSTTECVTAGKHFSTFTTDSSVAILREGHKASRIEYSVSARRWVAIPWPRLWRFDGTEIARFIDEPIAYTRCKRMEAATFSSGGDTLFVAIRKAINLRDSTCVGSLQVVDARSGNTLFEKPLGDGRVNHMLAVPDSPWIYLVRDCDDLRVEVVDRATLEVVNILRLPGPNESDNWACHRGNLVLNRSGENALYFVVAAFNTPSRIFRIEIPPPGAIP